MTTPIPVHLLTGNYSFESIYSALRAQARLYLRREQEAYSMSPTVLVHEAWIALARSRKLDLADRYHFVRLASRVMKNLLIDRARQRSAASNGGGLRRIEWNDALAAPEDDGLTITIAAALDDLAAHAPRLAALVEMRYFAGFSEAEVAQIMGISSRTVRRQWRIARLRLLEILESAGPAAEPRP